MKWKTEIGMLESMRLHVLGFLDLVKDQPLVKFHPKGKELMEQGRAACVNLGLIVARLREDQTEAARIAAAEAGR